ATIAAGVSSYGGLLSNRHSIGETRFQLKTIGLSVISTDTHHTGHASAPVDPRQVDNEMNGQRDRLANAVMRQADVGRQHAMRKTHQCLFRGVRMNRAQTSEMAGIERLQQVEDCGAT